MVESLKELMSSITEQIMTIEQFYSKGMTTTIIKKTILLKERLN